ncbi:MAG: hypothetical protein LC721_11625, partial [Actinobacteria bacterium]|nr:hypothetical protein [Actinomycetota bacterium]
MRDQGRITRLRTVSAGLAWWALFAFGILHLTACAVAGDGGSHGGAHTHAPAAAHTVAGHAQSQPQAVSGHAQSQPDMMVVAGHRCHHDAGHHHGGASDKLYASPRRTIDHLTTALAAPNTADESTASA